MSNPEINDFLSKCNSPEKSCFASDPEAFSAMIRYGDSVITADMRNAAAAANEAGIAGIPFEDVTYAPARLEILSTGTTIDYAGQEHKFAMGAVGTEDTLQRIEKPADNASGVDKMRYRIARCAYACGATLRAHYEHLLSLKLSNTCA